MVLVDGTTEWEGGGAVLEADSALPREVEFIISALEAGPRPSEERQKLRRTTYRVVATLKLFSDDPEAPPTVIYTRHVNEQAVGVLSPQPLTLSHGGVMRIRAPQGEMMEVACTVLRCREVAAGWYEGALYFNREQPCFAAGEM
jgi:hypothetical protein